MKLGIAAIIMLLILVFPVAYGLGQMGPSIFLFVSPDRQDVVAGGSLEFEVRVVPDGAWVRGEVSFELEDPPDGVTAVFVPDTWEYVDETEVVMIVEVASDVPEGSVVLKVVGSGRECCYLGSGQNVGSAAEIELTVTGSVEIEEPDEPEQPEQVVTVTVTVTSISFRSVSTTTVLSSVTSTVTDVITTRTPTIATSTTVKQLSQASDLAFPAVMLGVVAVLLSVAFVALRRKS